MKASISSSLTSSCSMSSLMSAKRSVYVTVIVSSLLGIRVSLTVEPFHVALVFVRVGDGELLFAGVALIHAAVMAGASALHFDCAGVVPSAWDDDGDLLSTAKGPFAHFRFSV